MAQITVVDQEGNQLKMRTHQGKLHIGAEGNPLRWSDAAAESFATAKAAASLEETAEGPTAEEVDEANDGPAGGPATEPADNDGSDDED